MNTIQLFTAALGLQEPWILKSVEFSAKDSILKIFVDFKKGGTFACPVCGAPDMKAYDAENTTWRHLNFFQHKTYLTARTPRVNCSACGKVSKVEVPWARKGSHFTLLFEAYVMALASEMPVNAIAKLVGEHDTRLWRIIKRHVEEARQQADYSKVEQIGVDETSSKRGHNYITLFMDLDDKRLLFATEGKGSDTVSKFAEDLLAHQGCPENISAVSCDLSQPFILGVNQHLPYAEIVFDRFHIMRLVTNAVDEVRRQESRDNRFLKHTRYLWLKNPNNLTAAQSEKLSSLSKMHLKTAKAYQIRLALAEFFNQPDYEAAEAYLARWYFWATHSRLEPIIQAAKTIKWHWDGIMAWHRKHINNAILEGTNSLIQAAKARARGYRTTENLITMAYLIAGKLQFNLPLPT